MPDERSSLFEREALIVGLYGAMPLLYTDELTDEGYDARIFEDSAEAVSYLGRSQKKAFVRVVSSTANPKVVYGDSPENCAMKSEDSLIITSATDSLIGRITKEHQRIAGEKILVILGKCTQGCGGDDSCVWDEE